MDFKEYQKLAMITKMPCEKEKDMAICALGLTGESGEIADVIKKHMTGYDSKGNTSVLEIDKIKKELGDIMWYVASLCECLDLDMEDIAQMNIDKLKKRHGDKYTGFGNRDND